MFRMVLAAALVAAGAAAADVNVPNIARSAASYRATIEAQPAGGDPTQLLRDIRQAETAARGPEAVRLYERLVGLNTEGFRAWLQLGAAWRNVDRGADKALAAAFNAYRAAGASQPNQIEALLLASSVLRIRLDQSRKEYEDGRDQSVRAVKLLALVTDPNQKEYDRSLDPTATGTRQTLERARDEGARRAEAAIRLISETAAELDEIYREVAAIVPGANLDRMQVQDARSLAFAPVTFINTNTVVQGRNPEEIRVGYRISGADIQACFGFNQDLAGSGLAYKRFVEVKNGKDEAATFGVEVKQNQLCLTGLEPGQAYTLALKEGLPAKSAARLVAASPGQEIRLPNLPARIAFSGKRFILPAGGPGEIPLRVTNVESFDLDLFRISDRTLHRHIALGHVGGDMPYGEYADLKDRFAERIWTGTVDVAPGAAKPNDPTRIGLRARSILEQRREWLGREIRAAGGGQGATASAKLPLPGALDEKATVSGQFFAGATSFEAATRDRFAPGVYALVTTDVARKDERADDDRDCSNKSTPDGRNSCDRFVVQWFLETDLGLAFVEGDTTFSVVARSFRSGEAKAGATVELVSSGNRVLASAVTDALGVASFPINLTRGTGANALVAILAHQAEDFGFLTFGRERLDLSRLNVDGRGAVQGFSAFLTSERGIYQPGETLNLVALLRDPDGRAPQIPPRTVVRVEARDRVLVQRRLDADAWTLGGARLELAIPAATRPGQARVTLALGEGDGAPVIGEMQVQVGAVRPDRARLDFLQPDAAGWATRSGPGSIDVNGSLAAQALYGIAGTQQGRLRDGKAEVVVKVGPAESPRPGCFPGFRFGPYDDRTAAVSTRQFLELLGGDGSLKLSLGGIPAPDSTRPLAATVEVTLFDTAGPLASRSRTFPIGDDTAWIGISEVPRLRPGSRPGTVHFGIDLVSSQAGGGGPLAYRLERERESYVWQRGTDSWQSVRSVEREPVGQGRIDGTSVARLPSLLAGNDGRPCPETLSAADLVRDLEIGRYVLTVTDPGTGRTSSARFNVGASSTDADQLEPNIFVLSVDKATYRPGDTIAITAEIPFESGEVLVALADGDVRHWVGARAQNRRATIRVPVKPEWVGRGLYALATAYRAGADGRVATGPARAIGAAHFEVKEADTGYGVGIQLVDGAGQRVATDRRAVGADEPLTFEICITAPTGCAANPPPDAYAAVFVVDEGLLSLTGQGDAPPDPERFFHGRKRFGLHLMDTYDRLLLKEGGDRPTRLALSNYTSLRIVSEARGPLKLERGRTTVTIPKLGLRNGSASIYAVVWTGNYAASRAVRVAVQSPIVADLDVPPFLLAGDRAILPVRLQNVSFAWDGEVSLRVAATGPVRGVAISADPARFEPFAPAADLRLPLRNRDPARTLYVALDVAPGGRGRAEVSLELDAPGSPVPLAGRRQDWAVDVRDADLPSVETVSFPLSRQAKSLGRLVDGIVADGYRADSVTVSAYFSPDPVRLLAAGDAPAEGAGSLVLDNLVWRGMRLLYASDRPAAGRDPEIQRILGDIQGLQLPNGSFAPYRTLGEYAPGEVSLSPKAGGEEEGPEALLRATFAFDFVSLARTSGYEVPDRFLRATRLFIAARAKTRREPCGLEVAYALFALVSHNPAAVDRKQVEDLKDCSSAFLPAKGAAAATLAKFGLPDQARATLAGFEESRDASQLAGLTDYQLALAMSFMGEAGASGAAVDTVADALLQLDRRASVSRAASAWILRGSAGRPPRDPGATRTEPQITVSGAPAGLLKTRPDGVLEVGAMSLARLRASSLAVSTAADGRARGRLVVEGVQTRPPEANRLPPGGLRRRYFDLETGGERNVARNPLRLGDRVVVVLEGSRAATDKAAAAEPGDGDDKPVATGPLVLADLLPSSFQILSEDVFGSGTFALTGALARLKPRGDLRSVETRADRWVAMIVPESRKGAATPAGDADAAPRPAPTPAPKPAATPEDDVEFRQAYLARVAMAGRFTVPPLTLEAPTPPIRSLRSPAASLQVDLPSAGDR